MIRHRALDHIQKLSLNMVARKLREEVIFNERYGVTLAFVVRTSRPSDSASGHGSSCACAVRGGGGGTAAAPTRAPRAPWRPRRWEVDVGRRIHIQASLRCSRLTIPGILRLGARLCGTNFGHQTIYVRYGCGARAASVKRGAITVQIDRMHLDWFDRDALLSQNRHIKGCAATQTVARAQRLCI